MNKKKKAYITGLIFVVITSIAISVYVKRSQIFRSIINQKIESYEKRMGVKIEFDNITMSGLKSIDINNLHIISPEKDTLLSAKSIQLYGNSIRFFFERNGIKKAVCDNVKVNIINTENYKNYAFLLKKSKDKSDNQEGGSNLHRKADKLANIYRLITRNIPEDISAKEVNIGIQTDSIDLQLYLPETQMTERKLFTQLLLKKTLRNEPLQDNPNKYWMIEGLLGSDPSKNSSLKIYSLCDNAIVIPYIEKQYNTTICFDTARITFSSEKAGKEEIRITGDIVCDSIDFFNQKIANNHILCNNFALDFSSLIGLNKIEIDSSSLIRINQFQVNPYLLWTKEDTIHDITLNLKNQRFEAQKLFSSIPDGICSHLKGIETEGDLSFQFHFKLNTNQVDSLEFSSALTPYNFNITKFGTTDFRDASKPFTYHVFEHGMEVESFIVGEENPNFVKADEVSTYLRHSILYSEDGFFFAHKGFYESALRSSLIKDIKERRFARGGSTISMQLVKNLWLSREKTLSRKLEEAMIVWLIENKRLLTKERMFEIYLNIIEWGPSVYGAKEASLFYFSKEPADLTIEEAIFMTSIIPRPKKFMWSFDQDHNLKPFLADYYKLLGEKLLSHEVILAEDFEKMVPNVHLSGRAESFLKKKVVPPDQDDEVKSESEYEEATKNILNNK